MIGPAPTQEATAFRSDRGHCLASVQQNRRIIANSRLRRIGVPHPFRFFSAGSATQIEAGQSVVSRHFYSTHKRAFQLTVTELTSADTWTTRSIRGMSERSHSPFGGRCSKRLLLGIDVKHIALAGNDSLPPRSDEGCHPAKVRNVPQTGLFPKAPRSCAILRATAGSRPTPRLAKKLALLAIGKMWEC